MLYDSYGRSGTTTFRPTNPGWGNAATTAKASTTVSNPRVTLPAGKQADMDYGFSAPTTPTPQAPTSFGGGGAGTFEDPALAQIRALAARSRSAAMAGALSKKKQATIEYGDPTGVQGIDEDTSKAARDNPFSVLKNLDRNYSQGVASLEDALNKSNLFYSGYRGDQLGKAATANQQDRYNASTRFRATITDIEDALAQALLNADMQEMNALWATGGRGVGGGGGGGGSGDQGAGLVGRPGESNPAGVPVLEGWNPVRNSDASYDITGLQQVAPDRWVDAFGWMYDSRGKRV